MELGHRELKPSGCVMSRSESESNGHLSPVSADSNGLGNGCSVLIVEPSLDELLVLMSRLTTRGFRVTVAETFAQAKPLLLSQPPSVLMTALRLGAYNGLHLVLRAKTIRPEIAALVTCRADDIVLRADAEAMGATFIVTPIAEKDLIAAVLQTISRGQAATPPIRPPFERRLGERRAAVESFDDERRSTDRRRVLPWMTEGSSSPV
jgi:two-component system, response regulator RegA